jgi:hypothetical protein
MANPVNPRVYYPIHAVGFAPLGTPIVGLSGYRAAKGVQSVSYNTSFNLIPTYELGQVSIYENREDLPNLEVTVSKVIDGYSLLEHLATPSATAATLAGRYNSNRCMMAVTYYDITNSFATGTPLACALFSGLYVSSLAWNLPVDGNITETVGLVGNNKQFFIPSGDFFATGTRFTGSETPVTASGGINRRQNVIMGSTSGSYWPSSIPGTSGIGNSIYVNPVKGDGSYGAHIQDVSINVNLGRTDLFELGRKGPYYRFANFPVEVTTSINVTAGEFGDGVDALEDRDNLVNEAIKINLTQGVIIDLGSQNKLQSITTSGGDTSGGNVTVTYTYLNNNDYTVRFTAKDPAGQ